MEKTIDKQDKAELMYFGVWGIQAGQGELVPEQYRYSIRYTWTSTNIVVVLSRILSCLLPVLFLSSSRPLPVFFPSSSRLLPVFFLSSSRILSVLFPSYSLLPRRWSPSGRVDTTLGLKHVVRVESGGEELVLQRLVDTWFCQLWCTQHWTALETSPAILVLYLSNSTWRIIIY